MMLGGMSDALLLIALGLGYLVFYVANREEKGLKALGFFLGTFIMMLAAVLLVSNTLFSARMCRMGKMGMMPGGRMMHGQMQVAPQAAAPVKK
jgi:hypothetical protein